MMSKISCLSLSPLRCTTAFQGLGGKKQNPALPAGQRGERRPSPVFATRTYSSLSTHGAAGSIEPVGGASRVGKSVYSVRKVEIAGLPVKLAEPSGSALS